MNGTRWLRAFATFFCIRSSAVSISTRTPAAFSRAAMSSRCGTWRSAIGMPSTCTGDSHGGIAPA
jgi:hypothetical protein